MISFSEQHLDEVAFETDMDKDAMVAPSTVRGKHRKREPSAD